MGYARDYLTTFRGPKTPLGKLLGIISAYTIVLLTNSVTYWKIDDYVKKDDDRLTMANTVACNEFDRLVFDPHVNEPLVLLLDPLYTPRKIFRYRETLVVYRDYRGMKKRFGIPDYSIVTNGNV